MTPARNNVRATRHFGIPARKSSPSAPLQPFPREKTRPARPSNRSRTKKFAQQQPNLGQTAKKLSQRAQKHQNLAIFPEQGELFRVSNAAPPSRENFLPQLHHSIPITGTPPPIHHPNRYKTLPTTPATRRNRYKTLPATPTSRLDRYKTLPACPQSTKTGHFSRAGRILSRSQHRATEQGEFSPATTPLNTHHRDTTTPTGTKPTQQRRRQRAQPGARVSTRYKTLPARPSNRSRAKKLAQQQPNLGQTAKKLSQRAQKHQNLAIFPEQGELFRVSRTNSPRRANFFAFPTPHHRAGRIFSRNNTTQHPSQGHHHPNRYKTLPATASPWPNREKTRPTRPRQRLSPGHESARAKEFAQHPLQPFPREKTRPATAQSWPNREKTLPARPKTPKSSHFSRAGRTFSRFPNQFTPQGELFRADSTLNV